uniref:Uncharacterized protein n=1 Tax=Cacopsylla melanoneura TaxID=428564 RepID=A0A8D9EC98_9HEMI
MLTSAGTNSRIYSLLPPYSSTTPCSSLDSHSMYSPFYSPITPYKLPTHSHRLPCYSAYIPVARLCHYFHSTVTGLILVRVLVSLADIAGIANVAIASHRPTMIK